MVIVLLGIFSIYAIFTSIMGMAENITGKIYIQPLGQIDPISALSIGAIGVFIGAMVVILWHNKKRILND